MKTCETPGCNYPVFSKRRCKKHWAIMYGKPIKKVSEKQRETLSKYKTVRAKYLEEHLWCEAKLEDCTKKATEIHHKKGKDNALLWTDTKYFMPICRNCHSKIENGGAWVYEKGFKIKRF
ncbi:HNH endonuclease signature motif containing protein [Riemerella anatipestifer]|nr:HNH endonuclease signature motif containing protein [Riemerella anatipestifer]